MEFFKALAESKKREATLSTEKFEINRVRATIEKYCEKYLKDSDDIFTFEALPSALDATIDVVESRSFQEKYEFEQVSETCFRVRQRELDIM